MDHKEMQLHQQPTATCSSNYIVIKNQADPDAQLPVETDSHNFTVAVRIKPREEHGDSVKLTLNKNCREMSIESGKNYKSIYYGSKCKTFKMDTIFDEKTPNSAIFNELVKDKLSLLRTNCNVSLMAYGATNSGKTYTIFGEGNRDSQWQSPLRHEGMAHLACRYVMQDLFKEKHKFYFSYLEIYNENIQDLMSEKPNKHYLNIFEDHNGKINIPDLTKVEVDSYPHLCQLIDRGNRIRAEASNNVNQISSRSHAILQLDIFSVQDNDAQLTLAPVDVNFMIIDLAGSEKSSPYFQESQQLTLKEGSNINKSLLALGNCIKNLANGDNHIPYRDSKLTRILKENLSGYCHNILVACISQHITQYEESVSTLQYASKACKIESIGNLRNLKNRSKFVNITCEHCRMGVDFNYITKALKHHSYEVVDMLNNKTEPTVNKSSFSNFTEKNYYSHVSMVENEENRMIDVCVELLKKLKNQQVSDEELKVLERQIRDLDQNQPKVEVNIQETEYPQPSQPEKRHFSQQPSRVTLKIKKDTDREVKLSIDRMEKQPKNVKISVNVREKQDKELKNEKSKPKLQFIKKDTSREKLKQKPQNVILIKDEPTLTSLAPSLKYSSIHSRKEDKSMQASSVTPFLSELNLDMSQLYSSKQRNSFIREEIDKDFNHIKNIYRKRNSEPQDQFKQNMNMTNLFEAVEDGPRTYRDCPPNYSRDSLNSVENRIAKRMKPDIEQQYSQMERIGVRMKQGGQQGHRSKIKLIAKLR